MTIIIKMSKMQNTETEYLINCISKVFIQDEKGKKESQ